MARNIGPEIGIDGEKEFKQSLKDLCTQAKALNAEMKAVTSSFTEETSSSKKAAAQGEVLSKQIKNQKDIIAQYQKKVEESAKAHGENATTTQEWKKKLYDAQAELNRLNHALDNTNNNSSKFSETLKALLSKEAIMGGLNAIKGGMEAIGKAAYNFSKEVVMAYADFEQLEGGIKKLFNEKDAATVIKNAQNAFKTSGLSANEYMETVTSFSASLISSLGDDTKQAAELADRAIRDMSDNANTFGTDMQSIQNAYQGFAKGQYNMLDNLKLGYGGTKTEMERLVLDAEKLNSSFKAQRDASGNLTLSFQDVVKAIGIVQDKMQITGTTAREASGTISGSIDSLKGAFQNFVVGLGMNNSDIDNLLGNVVESFQNVVNNVQPIIEQLIDYIPGVIGAVIPVLQGMAPELVTTATELFNSFLSAFISVLPEIVPVAAEAVLMFANTIIDNLPILIDAGINFVVALAKGFSDTLPDLVEKAPMLVGQFISGIINNLPNLLAAGALIVKAIGEGIATNFMGIFEAGWKVMDTIRDLFTGNSEAAHSWGADLIVNFANGIISRAKEVREAVKDVATSIWELLHFSEPETGPLKDFSKYGPDMMKTFAQGIRNSSHLVTEAASSAMQGVSDAMSAGSATSNAYNYGGFSITINQQPGQSADDLVDELMYKMQNKIDSKRAVFA